MAGIGERLKSVRTLLKKSQEELARELGITKQAISNIETGKSAPGIATLSKLLVDYDINLNYLISGIGEIILPKKENLKALRENILADVKAMLDSRGIY